MHDSIPVTYFTDKYAIAVMKYGYFLELIAFQMLSGSQHACDICEQKHFKKLWNQREKA